VFSERDARHPSFVSLGCGRRSKADSPTGIIYFHKEFSRDAEAGSLLIRRAPTEASAKRTVWRLRGRMEEESEGNEEHKGESVERAGKSQAGERVGLGVSAGRYSEWQASTSQLAVSRYEREGQPRERESAHVYVCWYMYIYIYIYI